LQGAVVLVVGSVVVEVSVSGVEVDDESTDVVDVSPLVSDVSLVGGSTDVSVGPSVDDEEGSTESSLATTPCE
jgi:hypothetical protein